MVAQGQGAGGRWGGMAKGRRFLLGAVRMSKIDCWAGCTVCECTRSHGIVHFKWMNCMVCELHLNQAAINKKLKLSSKN